MSQPFQYHGPHANDLKPDPYCPICGQKMTHKIHHCPPATLSAINGANTRAENDDDAPRQEARWFGTRLADGFASMNDEE